MDDAKTASDEKCAAEHQHHTAIFQISMNFVGVACRLAEQLAAATLMSTAAQLETDLAQLLDHALALKSHGEKQASGPCVSI